jgi:hypothetical protein
MIDLLATIFAGALDLVARLLFDLSGELKDRIAKRRARRAER